MKTKLLKKIRKRFDIKIKRYNSEDLAPDYILFDKKKKEYTVHFNYTAALDELFEFYYKRFEIINRRRYINMRARCNQIK